MGLFGSRGETPITGRMILRFSPEPFGRVEFTLDQGASGRVWMVGWAQLVPADPSALEGMTSFGEVLNLMIPNAFGFVLKRVPSATYTTLQAQLDNSGDDKMVACVGAVTFLASEWASARKSLAMASRV